MSNPKAKTPYKRRSYTQRLLASLTDAGGAGGRLDKDTLSPDDRAAANPYSSPVSGERSRARSSSYYAGAPRAHDMSRNSEDEEYDSGYTDPSASDDDEDWMPDMMESGSDSDDAAAGAAADGEEQDDDNNARYEFHGSRIVEWTTSRRSSTRCRPCGAPSVVTRATKRSARSYRATSPGLCGRAEAVRTTSSDVDIAAVARRACRRRNSVVRVVPQRVWRPIRVVRYAHRGGARGVPGPSVVRWTRSRAWEARTGIDKHNGLVKFHSTILLFACARVGPTGSNMLRCGILAPTARSVRKTKTVEWNLRCPLVWVTFLRFETAIAGILGPPLHPAGKIAHDSRNSGVTKLK